MVTIEDAPTPAAAGSSSSTPSVQTQTAADAIAAAITASSGSEPLKTFEPFLGMPREKCHILLALYHVTDPKLEAAVPALFPAMAAKFDEDRKEHNSLQRKLERGPEIFSKEVDHLQTIQKKVFAALLESDMNLEKAREILKLPKEKEMEDMTLTELLTSGFMLGGIREDGEGESTKKQSPLSSPNFYEAKAHYERAFEKFNFTMAAVQLGSFYLAEHQNAQGENCKKGENAELTSVEWYLKAAEAGNPMAMHKFAWYHDQKLNWDIAMEWYEKAADCGYPDSAHNLAMMYQEGNEKTTPAVEINIPLALEFYSRGVHYGYAPSSTQMGRLFFMLGTDKNMAARLPETDRAHTDDPQEYIMTAMSCFNAAATLGEAESLQFLGMIYGSQAFGMYDIERAQNNFELALIASHGGADAFEYLCRTLSARRALIAEKLAAEEKASGPNVDEDGLKFCSRKGCEEKEKAANDFKRCAGCKKQFYCSKVCQVTAWKEGHKSNCKK